MGIFRLISFQVMATLLAMGCDLPPNYLDLEGDENIEFDTPDSNLDATDKEDSDRNETPGTNSDDGEEYLECSFECQTAAKCAELNGAIRENMLCSGNLICCETATYKMMWNCLICE